MQAPLQSDLLQALTEASRWSDFQAKLDELQQASEWDKAEREGVVQPSKEGVDPAYDAAKAAVEQADKDLEVRGGGCAATEEGFMGQLSC